MTAPGKPFVVSLAGHVLLVGALIWLVGHAPPLQLPQQVPQNPVEVAFSVPAPPPEPPPLVAPQPPPPPLAEEPPPPPQLPVIAEEPPPPPQLPVIAEEPPPPPSLPVAAAEPPPPKPIPRRVLRPPVERRVVAKPERPLPERAPSEPRAAPVVPSYAPPVQTAALPPSPAPAPPTAPMVTAGYRAELSSWLESHKQYPQTARERGEQGRIVLRFRVARNGRVLSYSVAGSSGYPDLDAAVDTMMRGAVLPPFPNEMAAPEIEVAVTVRFALTR